MKQSPIAISHDRLKSPLAIAAAVFCALSALLAIAGIVLLFDKEFAALLVQDRIDGGIQQGSSLRIWYIIDTSITLLSFLCPAVLAAALFTVLRGRISSGMKLITGFFQVLLWGIYGSSVLVLVIFLVSMVSHIFFYLRFNEGVYLVYTLLVSEGLMGVQAWLIFLLIRKFLRDSADCAFSITYTLTSGKLDSAPIPSFPALGFLILGFAQLALVWDRIYTFTIIPNYVQDTYKILVAAHPGQYLAAVTLALGAVGNFLLSAYLRHYNRICERTRFQANRKTIT